MTIVKELYQNFCKQGWLRKKERARERDGERERERERERVRENFSPDI